MTRRRPDRALAEMTAALVADNDITDLLHDLVTHSARVLDADAVGLMAFADGTLDLLSATSHGATELELYQAQRQSGPCIDAARSGEVERASGADAIVERWPLVAGQIVGAGFAGAYAFPMRWSGEVIGCLNVFTIDPRPFGAEQLWTAQSLADLATLALVRLRANDAVQISENILDALEGRVIVEQAKGVLAHQGQLEMSAAYDALVTRADRDDRTLSETARRIIGEAENARAPGS